MQAFLFSPINSACKLLDLIRHLTFVKNTRRFGSSVSIRHQIKIQVLMKHTELGPFDGAPGNTAGIRNVAFLSKNEKELRTNDTCHLRV